MQKMVRRAEVPVLALKPPIAPRWAALRNAVASLSRGLKTAWDKALAP
jgi:hypothetical protein